jgi:hypothetical protein
LNIDSHINSRDLSIAENCRDPEEVDPQHKEELMDLIAGIQATKIQVHTLEIF